jgi:hypothetical protein
VREGSHKREMVFGLKSDVKSIVMEVIVVVIIIIIKKKLVRNIFFIVIHLPIHQWRDVIGA